MENDDDAVPGQMHVDFETIRSKRQPVVECFDRVFGPEERAASVSVNQWARGSRMS